MTLAAVRGLVNLILLDFFKDKQPARFFALRPLRSAA